MTETETVHRTEIIDAIASTIAFAWGKTLMDRQLKKLEIFTEDEPFNDLSEKEKRMACRVFECTQYNVEKTLNDCLPPYSNSLSRFKLSNDELEVLAHMIKYRLNTIAEAAGTVETYIVIGATIYNSDLD